MNHTLSALRNFLDQSHSVYHAQQVIVKELEEAGFCRLEESRTWSVQPGGSYYVIRGGSAVVAFRIPEQVPAGFVMSASHSDRPCFKLKENFELDGAYLRLAVER